MSLTGPTQRPLTTRRVRVRSVRDVSRHHMERVTGIEPAFSAWESVSDKSESRQDSRMTCSDSPCRSSDPAEVRRVSHRYGTDMARRLSAQQWGHQYSVQGREPSRVG